MDFVEFVFGITCISIIVGGMVKTAGLVFGRGGRGGAAELSAAQERARALEWQLVDAQRQNEQLQKQLEWHARLLETQDRLLRQPPESAAAR